MAPIVQGQKRYAVLERALKSTKITQEEFDYCVENGIALSVFKTAPPASELPMPSLTLVAPPASELPMPSLTLVAPPASKLPMPSPTLLKIEIAPPISPKSPHYDIEAARESTVPDAPRKKRVRFSEPFHGGVALMSLQETFDALADKVLQDTEEGIRKDAVVAEIEDEVRQGWWGFNILGR
jgi:hypothetical protein